MLKVGKWVKKTSKGILVFRKIGDWLVFEEEEGWAGSGKYRGRKLGKILKSELEGI